MLPKYPYLPLGYKIDRNEYNHINKIRTNKLLDEDILLGLFPLPKYIRSGVCTPPGNVLKVCGKEDEDEEDVSNGVSLRSDISKILKQC